MITDNNYLHFDCSVLGHRFDQYIYRRRFFAADTNAPIAIFKINQLNGEDADAATKYKILLFSTAFLYFC